MFSLVDNDDADDESLVRHTQIFSSKAMHRSHEEDVSQIVAKDHLNVGKIPTFKDALSSTATLCAYVKVDDLARFLGDLVNT